MKKLIHFLLAIILLLNLQSKLEAQDFDYRYLLYDTDDTTSILTIDPISSLSFLIKHKEKGYWAGGLGLESMISDSWSHWMQVKGFCLSSKNSPIFSYSSSLKYYTGGEFANGFYLRLKLATIYTMDKADSPFNSNFAIGGGLGLGWTSTLFNSKGIRLFLDLGIKGFYPFGGYNNRIPKEKNPLSEYIRITTFSGDQLLRPDKFWDGTIGLAISL